MVFSRGSRYVLLYGFLILIPIFSIGQKLDRILGEFIIQVDSDKDFAIGMKNIVAVDSRYATVATRQIMAEPLNLWLVSVDYKHLNELNFENRLQRQRSFKDVRRNRLITPRLIPNDLEFSKQWQFINTGLNGGVVGADMDMDLAWDISTGGITSKGDTIVVCVIDDGINNNHEDMKDNLWVNRFEIPGNGIDDDGNGYKDDVVGWNVVTNNDDVYTGGSHGTPVAGIVGAKGNNGIGVSGVNWNVKLMIVNYGSPSEANALAAYAYPFQMRKLYNSTGGTKGAFVVATNASWGIDKALAETAPLWCALYDSLGRVGILNCGATTNSSTDVDVLGDLPTSCASEHLISVTNLNRSDVKVNSAGFGRKTIDLGSYGHQAYTVARTGYGSFGGTSGATPHVSGAIGLLYSVACPELMNIAKQNPEKASLIVKDMILHGVTPNTSILNITTTGGKLNVHRAISNVQKLCEACSVPSGIVIVGNDKSLNVKWATNSGTSKLKCRYRKSDALNWKIISNFINGGIIDSLDFCTEYEVQISSDCGFIANEYSYSKFVSTSGCCIKPTNFNAIGLDSLITVSWKKEGFTSYMLNYKTGQGNWVATTVDTNIFILKNVAPCTGYIFRIKSMCNKYNNVSDFTEELIVSTSCGLCTTNNYCWIGKKDASQEWIESFKLGNIFNTSGSSNTGYRNFAGVYNTDLKNGQEYEFEIVARYGGTAFNDFFNIFIDYNQDGIWSKDENAFSTTSAVQNVVKGKFRVPDSALSGITRLRVIMAYEKFEGGCDQTNFEYGEVEDYCINIVSNNCPNRANVSVTEIEKTIVNFKAKATIGTIDSLLFAFREKGMEQWIEVKTLDTFKIAGLKECTVYEYQYRSKCSNLYSNVFPIDTFKTACPNSLIELANAALVLFPNPFSDYINIKLSGTDQYIKEIRIINAAGNLVLKQITDRSQVYTLDTKTLAPGIYFVEITGFNGKKQYRKLVKM